MANNQKLFYTLQESSSNDFAQSDIKNALGLVEPAAEDSFGYFIANGKQYGATQTQITNIANVAANNVGATKADKDVVEALSEAVAGKANASGNVGSFSAEGIEYTLSFVNNNLTLQKYQASVVTISEVGGDAVNEIVAYGGSLTNDGGGEYFLGYAYSISQSITFPTSLEVKVSIDNHNTNSLKAWVKTGDHPAYFFVGAESGDNAYEAVNGTKSYFIPYTAYTQNSISYNAQGNVTFSGTKTFPLSKKCASIELQYMDESKGIQKVTKEIEYSITTSVTCKYAYYIGTADISVKNNVLDATNYTINKYNSAKPSQVEVKAGETQYLIVPVAIGTPKFKNGGFNVSASSTQEYNISSIKVGSTTTVLGQSVKYMKYVLSSEKDATITISW